MEELFILDSGISKKKAILPFDQAVVFTMLTFCFSNPGTVSTGPLGISRYFLGQVLSNRASSVPSHFREPYPTVILPA